MKQPKSELTPQINNVIKKIKSKYEEIFLIEFGKSDPRTTVCQIIASTDTSGMHRLYGVAIRRKTDKEDIIFAQLLALKRAVKQYKKFLREMKK